MSPDDAEARYNKEWPAFNQRLVDAKVGGSHKKIMDARRQLSALSIKYDDRHRVEPEPEDTDKDKLVALLEEFGIESTETEAGSIMCEGGYCGFYTLFEFDDEGKFEDMGAYE